MNIDLLTLMSFLTFVTFFLSFILHFEECPSIFLFFVLMMKVSQLKYFLCCEEETKSYTVGLEWHECV